LKVEIYTLKTCDSCRKATKWLKENNIPFGEIPIRENPPSVAGLQAALGSTGDIRKLFNTSGQDYRNLGMKEKLPGLSEAAAISLLASNGNLIKRPILISGDIVLVGFKAEEWAAALLR
jgi:arsenate reductase